MHTLAELATQDTAPAQTHEIQTNDQGHILITGDDGNTIPVQVSGHQFVTIPVNSNNYQTVVANIQGEAGAGPGGGQMVQVNAPIQISGLQHLVMKTEPGEGGGGAGRAAAWRGNTSACCRWGTVVTRSSRYASAARTPGSPPTPTPAREHTPGRQLAYLYYGL